MKGEYHLLTIEKNKRRHLQPVAILFALSMAAPTLLGCGGPAIPPPVVDAPGTAPMANVRKPGMSTGKKVVIALAGAALLYYLVKKHKQQAGQDVQYYKSKSTGGIYYRDPKTHQAHWVTKGAAEAQQVDDVDENDTKELQKYQGYDKSTTGIDYQNPTKEVTGN